MGTFDADKFLAELEKNKYSKLDKLCIANCPFNTHFKGDKFGRFKTFNPCSPYHQEGCVVLKKVLGEEKTQTEKIN